MPEHCRRGLGARRGRKGTRVPAVAILCGAFGGAAAHASPAQEGWYGAIDLGAQLRQDGRTRAELPDPGGAPAEPRFHTALGPSGFLRVGRRVTSHIRLELEAGWRSNRMLSIVDEWQSGRPAGSIQAVCAAETVSACGPLPGGFKAWTLMANGVLDMWPRRALHPFAGGGLGVARVRLNTEGRFVGTAAPGSMAISDADAKPAAQAIGGVSLRLSPRLDADLTYRFLYSGAHRWTVSTTGPIQLGHVSGKYEAHALTLGLRYRP
jgi:opacity protein-like surface antigen